MFRRILVPLDGSARAERALPVAARLARALDGTLILVQVVIPPLQPATSLAPPLDIEAAILLEERNAASAYLTQVTQQPELAAIRHESIVLEGSPAEMILDAVQASKTDLLILCSHGRTGLLRWVLGSVAQRLIHHAPIPVLVLRQQGPLPLSDDSRPLRALVPLDGSWLAEAAIGPAAALASALAPQRQRIVHLVQVVRLATGGSQAGARASRDERAKEAALRKVQDYLSHTADRLGQGPLAHPQVKVTCSAIADQDVAGTLVDLAQRGTTAQGVGNAGSFDLIAMTMQGQGGLQRWMMGSIAERVLSASKVPLLVLRPKEVGVPGRLIAHFATKEATQPPGGIGLANITSGATPTPFLPQALSDRADRTHA